MCSLFSLLKDRFEGAHHPDPRHSTARSPLRTFDRLLWLSCLRAPLLCALPQVL